MKVIDLLNKIANGEEVPIKIKWENTIYAYSEYDKDYLEFPFSEEEYKGFFNMRDIVLTQCLHDQVEIVEEEPKDIEVCGILFTKSEYDKLAHSEEGKKIPRRLGINDITLIDLFAKINEIIDYLKSKGE